MIWFGRQIVLEGRHRFERTRYRAVVPAVQAAVLYGWIGSIGIASSGTAESAGVPFVLQPPHQAPLQQKGENHR